MNILCGVINQTDGSAYIDGINVRENPVEAKKLIGFYLKRLRYTLNLQLMNILFIVHIYVQYLQRKLQKRLR